MRVVNAVLTAVQEFARSGPDTRVYKRAGPVLLPQDFQEASDNVTKRIEFIQTELYVLLPRMRGVQC